MTEQEAVNLRDALDFAMEIMNKSRSRDKRMPNSKRVIRRFVEELDGELAVVPQAHIRGTVH